MRERGRRREDERNEVTCRNPSLLVRDLVNSSSSPPLLTPLFFLVFVSTFLLFDAAPSLHELPPSLQLEWIRNGTRDKLEVLVEVLKKEEARFNERYKSGEEKKRTSSYENELRDGSGVRRTVKG